MIAGCFDVLLQQLQKQIKYWLPGTDQVLIQVNLSLPGWARQRDW